MSQQNFQCSITANVTPAEAYNAINRVSDWWTANLTGSSLHLNDQFTVLFGATYATMKITESIPGKKVVWKVVDCYLDFIKDKHEWTGTDMVFEIHPEGKGSRVDMTHVGLTPQVECFEDCKAGWTFYITQSLHAMLTTGKGKADKQREMQEG